MDELRHACEQVARRARFVHIQRAAIPAYAAGLEPAAADAAHAAEPLAGAARERQAAFWLTMDAINFGSGWFPTLNKPEGRSGYHTIFAALEGQWKTRGPWSPAELTSLEPATVADVFGQDPEHPLMALFAASLNDLGRHVAAQPGASFGSVVDAANGSAVTLARQLGGWASFADCSRYQELELPFLKRAQIAAADLARAGVAQFADLGQLTLFADNLVPHVLRLDGILTFSPELVARIDAGELIEPGSPEEIEIRACALYAVELIVATCPGARAVDIDELLWNRGAQPFYKASPRHRARCTAY